MIGSFVVLKEPVLLQYFKVAYPAKANNGIEGDLFFIEQFVVDQANITFPARACRQNNCNY